MIGLFITASFDPEFHTPCENSVLRKLFKASKTEGEEKLSYGLGNFQEFNNSTSFAISQS
jgi:hypothetical protein